MDGLAVVVRGFTSEAVPHPEGSVDPARDLELLETEMLLADLSVVTNRLDRVDQGPREEEDARARDGEEPPDALPGGARQGRAPARASRSRRTRRSSFEGLRPADAKADARDPERERGRSLGSRRGARSARSSTSGKASRRSPSARSRPRSSRRSPRCRQRTRPSS